MKDEDKKRLVEMFREHVGAFAAFDSIKDETERSKARALAEEAFVSIAAALEGAAKIVRENPEKVTEALSKKIDKV